MTDDGPDRTGTEPRRPLDRAADVRRRALLVAGLRGFAASSTPGAGARSTFAGEDESGVQSGLENGAGEGARSRMANGAPTPPAAGPDERCDLCGTTVAADHRHLLNLVERRIECVCESCWALRSGDAEFRPTGTRTLWLPELDLPDDVWAGFQIPIGLAFFMQSTVTGCVTALYPSPAGATESELHFVSWSRLVALNPVLADLEADVEGLIVNRLADPPIYAIAPIDRCYALTGTVKLSWQGISGGAGVSEAVAGFFAGLRAEALADRAAGARKGKTGETARQPRVAI